jgi:hypothetical protein
MTGFRLTRTDRRKIQVDGCDTRGTIDESTPMAMLCFHFQEPEKFFGFSAALLNAWKLEAER